MLKKSLIAFTVLAVITAIVFLSLQGKSSGKGKEVYSEKAEKMDIVSVVSASGEIQPKKQVNISSDVIGKIEVLNVKEGDSVSKGQMLLQLDKDIYQSEVDSIEAALKMSAIEVENRKLNLSRAEQTLDRNRSLFEKHLISQDYLDDIELNFEAAKIAVRGAEESVCQAEAALRKAGKSLRNTILTSPLDGIVTSLNAEEGETVMTGTMNNPGTVIMTISDMGEVNAELEVDESDVVKLGLNQEAVIIVDAIEDQKYSGKVTEIGSSASMSKEGVPVFDVEITIDNPDGRLLPGMSTDGKIETGSSVDIIAVPIQAVVTKDRKDSSGETGNAVFLLKNNQAELVFVETGLSNETHIEVTSGISEGDRVITGPYRILRDLETGDAVTEKEIKRPKERKAGDDEDESEMEVRVN